MTTTLMSPKGRFGVVSETAPFWISASTETELCSKKDAVARTANTSLDDQDEIVCAMVVLFWFCAVLCCAVLCCDVFVLLPELLSDTKDPFVVSITRASEFVYIVLATTELVGCRSLARSQKSSVRRDDACGMDWIAVSSDSIRLDSIRHAHDAVCGCVRYATAFGIAAGPFVANAGSPSAVPAVLPAGPAGRSPGSSRRRPRGGVPGG
mmetsp:Transcript_111278/g.227838  ORF Transcript_111278/g.227838 Transcript_111278/m.227838 type:complete len:209 (-) Transcript_111278:240-866(-)